MADSFKQLTTDTNQALASFRKDEQGTMQGFSDMAKNAMAEGSVSALNKELIALAIGVTSRCDACIGFHVKTLVKLGVTREQLTETLAVCTYMGGGPALMYVAQAIRAFEEFSATN